MKNALVSVILVALLLAGFIGGAINLAPVAATEVKYLTISYLPSDMPEPSTVPAVGTYELTAGSEVVVEAPDTVNGTEGVRYVFDKWCVYNEERGTWYNTTNNPHTITLDANKTAYARYYVEYKLTIITPYSTPCYQVEGESWVQAAEAWLDEGTTVRVGVPVDEELQDTDVKAVFDYWSGDASGDTRISDWFNMTGPKTAIANWYLEYYLDVDKQNIPPDATAGWDYVPVPPGEGWYEECVTVKLNATDIPWTSGELRWKFDHWELDGQFYSDELNITVHIDGPHNATVHYIRQYWIDVSDDIGGLSNVSDFSSWVNSCDNLTVTAVPEIPASDGVKYVFVNWEIDGQFFTDLTIEVHAEYPPPDVVAHYQLMYYLTVQDNIEDQSGVSVQSGWYPANQWVDLGAPKFVYINDDTRYKFVKWVKDPGGYEDTNNETRIIMNGPRTATAYYQLQYKLIWDDDQGSSYGGFRWYTNNSRVCTSWFRVNDLGGYEPPMPTMVFHHWTIIEDGVPRDLPEGEDECIRITAPTKFLAHFLNETFFIITGGSDIIKVAPGALGDTFDVNVIVANFEADRHVDGKPMDLYGVEFNITWDSGLIRCIGYTPHLENIWPQSFISAEEIGDGYFLFAASAYNATEGFEGTEILLTLHFEVIYEPCYPYKYSTLITVDYYKFVNHLNQRIWAENFLRCKYTISAKKPILAIKPSIERIEYITEETRTFTVDIVAYNLVKVKDYEVAVYFDYTMIHVVDIIFNEEYFKPPYLWICSWYDNEYGVAYAGLELDIEQGAEKVSGNATLFTIVFKVVIDKYYDAWWKPGEEAWKIEILFDPDSYLSGQCEPLGPPDVYYEYPDTLDLVDADPWYVPAVGDLNYDGHINLDDLMLIRMDFHGTTYDIAWGYGSKGIVDIFDQVLVALNIWKGPLDE